jgi:CRP-like cAMP-binding protein
MPGKKEKAPTGNRVLSALTQSDAARLRPHLDEVWLERDQIFYQSDSPVTRVFFPHGGLVSLMTVLKDGPRVQAAIIGRDGVVGLPMITNHQVSPSQTLVQAPCRAAAIAADRLNKAMLESATLRALLGRFVHAFLAQVLQSVSCNAMHSTEKRLAKWLLLSADRIDGTEVPLTHELVAEVLGVGRPTVTLVARELQTAGLMRYRRGLIAIIDRPGLHDVSCECYGVIRRAYERMLPLTHE